MKFSAAVVKHTAAAGGDGIYFLRRKKNLRVKSRLEHLLFLASAVVSA